MRKFVYLTVFCALLFICSAVCADDTILPVYGETYLCGDSFEIIIPDEPVTTTAVVRNPGGKVIQARAGKHDMLLEIRLKIRNLTPVVYEGLNPDSLKLVGYVRGRPISYTPEIMEPYDYGGRGSYTLYDKMYYRDKIFPPLRKYDMILVYRVNPILRDFELHINPSASKETADNYLDAQYHEMDLEPCNGIFQISTLHDAETGEITKYYR